MTTSSKTKGVSYSRSNYVKQLCTQFVRDLFPDAWEQIKQESFRRFPAKRVLRTHDLSSILKGVNDE